MAALKPELKRESAYWMRGLLAGARRLCYLRNVSSLASHARAFWFVSALSLMGAGATLGAVRPAHAHGSGIEKTPVTRPPAPPGDGAQAEKLLAQVEAAALGPRMAKVVQAAVDQAAHALERAAGARAAGDGAHARLLDGLALEWAETARDLLRAAKAEEEALARGKKARELEVQVERARALLAESEARRGRAAADLQQAEAAAREAAQKASEVERERLEKDKGQTKGASKDGKGKSGAGKKSAGSKKGAQGAARGVKK